MMDKESPAFWRDIRPGSTITLSDEQALEESMSENEGVSARDYVVESIWKIREESGMAEWLLFKLDDEDQPLYVMIKIVDERLDARIYFEPDEFPPGNRADVVNRGDNWLFNEPPDVDHFQYNELEFANEITFTFEYENEDGTVEEAETVYVKKGQGVLHGTCTREPALAGMERMLATVVEYETEDETENPEVMTLELGGEKSKEGGLLSMMLGAPISLAEIDVLKSQVEKPVVRKKPTLWEKALKKVGS